jgi:uncharacterized protein YyaL (SSP411 family)
MRERIRTLVSQVTRDVRGKDSPILADEHHVDAAVGWLYESQDVTGCGGSAAAYNLVLGWQGAFPETSGYIVTTLYDYATVTGSPEAAERAERMASWLLGLQNEDGSYSGYDTLGRDTGRTVFDTGQIVFGLLRAGVETGDERYHEAAEEACDWLVDVQSPDGFWDRHTYSGTHRTYACRVAWALLEAEEILGSDRYRDAAIANLEWTVTKQRANSWFDNCAFTAGDDPFLHTIAYTVRGLLEGGIALDDEPLFEAASRTADRLLTIQDETGLLRGQYGPQWEPRRYYCLTGNAQMAIVWYRLHQTTGDERYRVAARRTLEFLKSKQRLSGPPQVRGGLRGSDPVWGRYMYLRYPNWAAKFFIDAFQVADLPEDAPPH